MPKIGLRRQLSVSAGAETGAGGRMRDTHATGIGSIMGAGTVGYCVGNLQLDGTPLPGEDASFSYPESLASPLQVTSRPSLPRGASHAIACLPWRLPDKANDLHRPE